MSDQLDRNLRYFSLPEVKVGRCVHALIQNASCQACAVACHANALRLTDKEPFIDPDICDGCGICAGVCPELAIEHVHHALSIQFREGKIALVACEKISEHSEAQPEGIVNCVHALSIRDLAELYGAGHHRLLVSTATCEDCHRGSEKHLEKHLGTLNSLLEKSSEPQLERINISPDQYFNIVRSAVHNNAATTLSRRNFFRRATSEISRASLRRFEFSSLEKIDPAPIARLLFTISDAQALPYVPQINTGCCTACDTCLKLCPHDALVIDRLQDTSCYTINAENCTGCGVCVDICEDGAITINQNTIASKTRITLTDGKCQTCGIHFHSIDAQPASVCLTCQQKKYAIPLFQVLN